MKNFVFVIAMVMMIGCGSEINGNDVYDVVDIIETEDAVKLDVLPEDINDIREVNDVMTDVDDDTSDAVEDAYDTINDNDVEDTDVVADVPFNDVALDAPIDVPAADMVDEDTCEPNCEGKECGGDDGCGGTCGECATAENGIERLCQEGMCVCEMFKFVKENSEPVTDNDGNEIYLNCNINIVGIYANGMGIDINKLNVKYTCFIAGLQAEHKCDNNFEPWVSFGCSPALIKKNETCEFVNMEDLTPRTPQFS